MKPQHGYTCCITSSVGDSQAGYLKCAETQAENPASTEVEQLRVSQSPKILHTSQVVAQHAELLTAGGTDLETYTPPKLELNKTTSAFKCTDWPQPLQDLIISNTDVAGLTAFHKETNQ